MACCSTHAVSKHEKTHCAEILDELKQLLGITWLQSGFPALLIEVLSYNQ